MSMMASSFSLSYWLQGPGYCWHLSVLEGGRTAALVSTHTSTVLPVMKMVSSGDGAGKSVY